MRTQILPYMHSDLGYRQNGKSPTLPYLPTINLRLMTDIYRYPMEFTISTELTNSGGLRISGNVD